MEKLRHSYGIAITQNRRDIKEQEFFFVFVFIVLQVLFSTYGFFSPLPNKVINEQRIYGEIRHAIS